MSGGGIAVGVVTYCVILVAWLVLHIGSSWKFGVVWVAFAVPAAVGHEAIVAERALRARRGGPTARRRDTT